MKYQPMTLPDNPKKALDTLGRYLHTLKDTPDREVREGGEVVGYWQTPEWLEGLRELACECERLCGKRDSSIVEVSDGER